MSWIRGVLIAIDQLGNAVAGGNPDATISARTGYFANVHKTRLQFYWKILEYIINCAFYPVDGPDHCYNDYLAEQANYFNEGSDFLRAVLGLIIIVFCIPIAFITRIYVLLFPKAKFDYEGSAA